MIDVPRHAITIVGRPLCGKGTHAKNLVERFGYFPVDTGDILRKMLREGDNPLTEKVRGIISAGKLVSDEIMRDIVFQHIPSDIPDKIAFVGFPRSVPQARWLLKSLLVPDHFRIAAAILNVPEEVSTLRMDKRIEEAVRSGEKVRPDDNPKTLRIRLDEYPNYGPQVEEYLKNNIVSGAFLEVDASLPKERVWFDIMGFVRRELETIAPKETTSGFCFNSPVQVET